MKRHGLSLAFSLVVIFFGIVLMLFALPVQALSIPPAISLFYPTTATQGTAVTITGSNLSGATAVSFGGIAAQSFTIDYDTQITAVVGNGASGSVSVTNAYGTGSLGGFTFNSGGIPTYLSVILQGSSRPDTGWIAPVTLKFFSPGANVSTAIPIYSLNLTTSKSGNIALAQITGIASGIYDITVCSTTTLCNVKRAVNVPFPTANFNLGTLSGGGGGVMINMGTLLEGNANGNTIINIQDFGILAASYGKTSTTTGFDSRADFDRNGVVNIADFGLLATNYGKYSPVEIP